METPIENQPRTPKEITDLKSSWSNDPCWDIEDTTGFEAHREELTAFRKQKETQWAQERTDRLTALSEKLGCPGNLTLAAYIETLEAKIKGLQSEVEHLNEKTKYLPNPH